MDSGSTFAPGTVLLGKYRVEEIIGGGGMGVVLKARHLELEEYVAIKCLLPAMATRDEMVARFLREGRAAVKLRSEHVVRVLDVGHLDNRIPYMVMEYLDGADLRSIIKHQGPVDPALAVDLIVQACEAMAEAHSLGIVHRDIKASNLFVSQHHEAPILKVLDFGIATAPTGVSDLTNEQVIGTPSYMAPEQMRSSRSVDARSDIWSLGVVLYELLEGARPFRGSEYAELCLNVGMDAPAPFTMPVPAGLEAIVMKCLEKDLEHRYQTVAELANDLLPFSTDPGWAHLLAKKAGRHLLRRSRPGDAEYDEISMVRAPTPSPQRDVTPTSIKMSRGQSTPVAPVASPSSSRRGWMALAVLVIACATTTGVALRGGERFDIMAAATATPPSQLPAPAAETAAAAEPAVPVPTPASEAATPTSDDMTAAGTSKRKSKSRRAKSADDDDTSEVIITDDDEPAPEEPAETTAVDAPAEPPAEVPAETSPPALAPAPGPNDDAYSRR